MRLFKLVLFTMGFAFTFNPSGYSAPTQSPSPADPYEPINYIESIYELMNSPTTSEAQIQIGNCRPACKTFACKPIIISKKPYDLGPLEAKGLLEGCSNDIEKQYSPWATNTVQNNLCPGSDQNQGYRCEIVRGYADVTFESTFHMEPVTENAPECKEAGPFDFSYRVTGSNQLSCTLAARDCYLNMVPNVKSLIGSCAEGCSPQVNATAWKRGIQSEGPPCVAWAEISGNYKCVSTPKAPKKWKLWKEMTACFPCEQVQ